MTLHDTAEVIVVGAGPAGCAVAADLARRGRDVLLVDRASFPRPKPCGECLNPGAVRALERLGLGAKLEAIAPRPLRGWVLVTAGGRRLFAPFRDAIRGWGIDRHTLDSILLEQAVERGVRFAEGFRVTDVDPGGVDRPARARGTTSDGTPFDLAGSILIGADGLRSVVARRIGAMRGSKGRVKASLTWRLRGTGPADDRGRLYLAGDRTVGLAPVRVARASESEDRAEGGKGLWNATLVVSGARDRERLRECGEGFLRQGLSVLVARWESGFDLVDGPWASGPFHWPVEAPVLGRSILVGDAAGYYDPLTGQGMFRALRGAELAAEAVDRALSSPPADATAGGTAGSSRAEHVDEAVLRRYGRSHRRTFRTGYLVQRIIERVVSHRAPRELVFSLLQRWPAGSTALVRMIGDVPLASGRVATHAHS